MFSYRTPIDSYQVILYRLDSMTSKYTALWIVGAGLVAIGVTGYFISTIMKIRSRNRALQNVHPGNGVPLEMARPSVVVTQHTASQVGMSLAWGRYKTQFIYDVAHNKWLATPGFFGLYSSNDETMQSVMDAVNNFVTYAGLSNRSTYSEMQQFLEEIQSVLERNPSIPAAAKLPAKPNPVTKVTVAGCSTNYYYYRPFVTIETKSGLGLTISQGEQGWGAILRLSLSQMHENYQFTINNPLDLTPNALNSIGTPLLTPSEIIKAIASVQVELKKCLIPPTKYFNPYDIDAHLYV